MFAVARLKATLLLPPWLPVSLATAIAFGCAAYFSVAFTLNADGIAAIWPANGVVLAVLLLTPAARTRRAVLAATLLANILVNFLAHRGAAPNIGFSLTNLFEIYATYRLLQALQPSSFRFTSVRSFGHFTIASFGVSAISAIAATIVAALTLEAVTWRVFGSWLFADFLGFLAVTPALVILWQKPDGAEPKRSNLERNGLFAILAVAMILVAGLPAPLLAFLVMPAFVVIACRLGPRDTSAAALMMSAIVLVCTAFGNDHAVALQVMSTMSDVQLMQLLVLTAFPTVMPLAEVIASHGRLQSRLSSEILLRDELNASLAAKERAITEKQAELEQAHSRLKEAIDVLPEGIVILDAENRYVAWNKRYAEIYHRAADTLVVGRSLEEALRMGLQRSMYPSAIGREKAWLDERISRLNTPAAAHEQWLDDGRCYLVEERRTSEGGLISLRIDITEMKQRESSIRLLFENNPLPMFVVAKSNLAIRAVNAAAVSYYGYSRADFSHLSLKDIQKDHLVLPSPEQDAGTTCSAGGPQLLHHYRRDGRSIEVEVYLRSLVHENEEAYLIAAIDVTERRIADRKAAYMARHDALTSLPNRHLLAERMQSAMARARRGETIALLLLDLDNFKAINDTLGHAAGDELLQIVAERLRTALREIDTVARLGGDEFAVLVVDCESPGAIAKLAERIIDVLNEPVHIGAKDVTCGGSVGIAMAPDDSCDAIELFRLADLALYAAKETQRGTYRMFEKELDAKVKARNRLKEEVRDAIINDRFELYYQPIICLTTLAPIGAEALLRWRRPGHGLTSPAEFIPLAEEIGMIADLGRKVMRLACSEAASWPEHTRVSVNVSAIELEAANFVDTVKSVLSETGLPSHRLIIEVTESTVMKDIEHSKRVLNEIVDLGAEVAMDDFGTGYSSLGSLTNVPFHKIKIDRSFVRDLSISMEARAILSTIVDLAKTLGMRTTAEGVETADQLAIVQEYGCTSVQGYLFHRPLAVEDVRPIMHGEALNERSAA